MSTPHDPDTGNIFSPVGSLRPDGTLEGDARARTLPGTAAGSDAPLELGRPLRHAGARTPVPDDFGGGTPEALPPGFRDTDALELAPHVRQTDRPEARSAFLTPPAPEKAFRLPRAAWKLLVLLMVAGLGYGLWQQFQEGGTMEALQGQVRAVQSRARAYTQTTSSTGGSSQGAVLFLSTPDGASVTIDGEEIGVTPFAGDLRWRRGAEITFTRRGYAPWKSTLPVGPEVKLDITLKRAPAR